MDASSLAVIKAYKKDKLNRKKQAAKSKSAGKGVGNDTLELYEDVAGNVVGHGKACGKSSDVWCGNEVTASNDAGRGKACARGKDGWGGTGYDMGHGKACGKGKDGWGGKGHDKGHGKACAKSSDVWSGKGHGKACAESKDGWSGKGTASARTDVYVDEIHVSKPCSRGALTAFGWNGSRLASPCMSMKSACLLGELTS